MNIKQILKELGIPSNEIKSRLANKQIKLNGENFDYSTDLNVDEKYVELGDFIFNNIELFGHPLISVYLGDIQYLFDVPLNWKRTTDETKQLCELLESHICISTSKKHHWVFKKI